MKMRQLCKREVVGIEAHSPVHAAAALMREEHVGALVVMAGDDPPGVVGIVTDRDLALDVLGRAEVDATQPVGPIAKAPPVAVRSDADLREAAQAMEQAGVRRLLVVDPDGGVVGIVSSDDLVRAMAEELRAVSAALGSDIAHERANHGAISRPAARRPVFPAFGTAPAQ